MAPKTVADALARVVGGLPSGEVRDGQRTMAEAVAAGLSSGRHVAVAAGTGTGKSFAYLVPVALSNKRVVVATATKALQDQLATKDLPLVAAGLGSGLTWSVLKGRSNYLCRQRLAELDRLGDQQRLDDPGATGGGRGRAAGTGDEVRRLVEFAATTASGDRAELDFEPSHAAWSSVSVTADECPGARRCPSGGGCFAEAARQQAAEADVVVVNLHLYGSHLKSGGEVLPEHDALVVDEAHELEDVLAATLGVEVSPGRLRGLAGAARASLAAARRRVGRGDESLEGRAVDGVVSAAERLEDVLSGRDDRRLPVGLGQAVGEVVSVALEQLERLAAALRRAAEGEGGPVTDDAAQRCLRSLLAVDRCRTELQSCLEATSSEVVWATGGERPSIRSAPLDVSTQLAAQVFEQMPVVLTSATLPRGLAARLGAAPEATDVLDVGSPFPYREHGLIYCAVDLPDRRSDRAEAALHDEIVSLVTAAGGRTLALFTSRRAMQAAAAAIGPRLEWPVLTQGELPKAALLEALAARDAACLFATMSFWQGVDVAGPALTLVILDKLPFPRPDDPLMAARREAAGSAGFRTVDLPRAATLLAQGAGRLIRTATDRGVVAVLDPRLAKASYGPALVAALPPMRRTKARAEAEAFLSGLHAEALAAEELAG